MSKDLVVQMEDMERVVEQMCKGKNPTEISRELGISRAKVLDHIQSWRTWAGQDNDIKQRAKETLARVDTHYQDIIKELWVQVAEAKNQNSVRDSVSALKAIGALEKDRASLFQSAGITADDQLTEQLMETERKQEILMDVLREVNKCLDCRTYIRKRLADITGKVEVIQVVSMPDS